MPLAEGRDGIAPYWGENKENESVFWQSKPFTSTEIITAYLNYCHRMIAFFEPDYFCYAVEANASFSINDPIYQDFLVFCDTVYNTLKAEYPNLPIMLSLVTNFLGGDIVTETSNQLLQYSDYVAMSSYPFLLPNKPIANADPQQIPGNWFDHLPALAPNKPICITETAYIAEDLSIPAYHIDLKGREEWQALYVNDLLSKMNSLSAEFVIWFTARDYDYAGQKLEGIVDPAYYIWKDTGLLDGDGKERPAAEFWKEWKSLKRE